MVERVDAPVRPGLHDTAFHGGKNEDSQAIQIASRRKTIFRFAKEAPNRTGPSRKIGGDALVRGQVLSLDLESQTPDRTSIPVLRGQEALPVTLQNGEYALQRIGD